MEGKQDQVVEGECEDATMPLLLPMASAPPRGLWRPILVDVERRSFMRHLPKALPMAREAHFYDIVNEGTSWQHVGRRDTAWMVCKPCTCTYKYGQTAVQPVAFPPWMTEVMRCVMPLCGITNPREWPNSCNLNRYQTGSAAVGWHADDEDLFQGRQQDCLIISLSLGAAREFHVRGDFAGGRTLSVTLQGGDLCTMEGRMQRFYKHAALPASGEACGPRLNLTWRWVVQHGATCPARWQCGSRTGQLTAGRVTKPGMSHAAFRTPARQHQSCHRGAVPA